MKKIILLLILCLELFFAKSQQIIPAKVLVNPDSADQVLFGGLNFNSSPEFIKSLATAGQAGILLNFINSRPGSKILKATQVSIDFNPIIVGWDPFSWKGLGINSIDSFYVDKLPYAEDCFIHFGFKSNHIQQRNRYNTFDKKLGGLFADIYWRPYKIEKDSIEYRFAVVNASTGYQLSPYIKNSIPSVFGFSIQANYMYINESNGFLNSYKEIVGNRYKGVQYLGTGAKIMFQYKFVNFYMDIRQYFALDKKYSGHTFTQNPTILVGAFINAKHDFKKSGKSSVNQQHKEPKMD